MAVHTIHEFNDFSALPPEVLSTYFHEYIHFIQDITTAYGLNIAWNSYDRIRQLIKMVQQSNEPMSFPLPDSPEKKRIVNMFNFLWAGFLDTAPIPLRGSGIAGLNLTKVCLKERFETGKLESANIKYVRCYLTGPGNGEARFWFGGLAINETLAYLVQKKFFPQTNVPDYPYRAGIHVANFLCPKLNGNEEFIYALSDCSLMYPYPGWAFYEIASQLEKSSTPVTKAEDIYAFAKDLLNRKWLPSAMFMKFKENLVHTVKEILGHRAFEFTLDWVVNIIEKGYLIRSQFPHFMLEIYRSTRPFDFAITTVMMHLGTPELMNLDGTRYFKPPAELDQWWEEINSIFLIGAFNLHVMLLYGPSECRLIEHCKASKQTMPVDNNCTRAPWLKVKETPICPFAGYLISLGLDTKL